MFDDGKAFMRTTLAIDDDVLSAAKEMRDQRASSTSSHSLKSYATVRFDFVRNERTPVEHLFGKDGTYFVTSTEIETVF